MGRLGGYCTNLPQSPVTIQVSLVDSVTVIAHPMHMEDRELRIALWSIMFFAVLFLLFVALETVG